MSTILVMVLRIFTAKKVNVRLIILFILLMPMVLLACGGPSNQNTAGTKSETTVDPPSNSTDAPLVGMGGEPIDPTATFTRVQNEVFTPRCSAIVCHDPLGQQQGMILLPGRTYANTFRIPSTEMPSLLRIAPSDPANSYLYRKITGAGITGDRMPQGEPPLPDEKIRLIRDWIRRGAPND